MTVSQASYDALPPSLRRRATTVVHGVDLSRSDSLIARRAELRAHVRSELGVGQDELLFMTVANLRPEKGYDVLLTAARSIADNGLPIRIAAVGRGPLSTPSRHVTLTWRSATGSSSSASATTYWSCWPAPTPLSWPRYKRDSPFR